MSAPTFAVDTATAYSRVCPACQATIYFTTNPSTGRTVPVDADGVSHYTTCCDPARFSKRRHKTLTLCCSYPGCKATHKLELPRDHLEVSSTEFEDLVYSTTAWEPSPPRCEAHLKERVS